jgi:hypothetical protein
MRAQLLMIGLVQAALLAACTGSQKRTEGSGTSTDTFSSKSANTAPVDAAHDRAVSPEETSAGVQGTRQWFGTAAFDPASRLIVRTGQASIEVDSLNPSMAELRRIVQRVGGFVADASIQSGRNQIRSATLQVKIPSDRFDDLTAGLEPLGRLQFVNVGAQDVSEEFVDLTARVENGHRLEDRLVELLRTRTGKLQDVLTVERELARIREEIERMEGRLRFLKTSAQLSTLSISLFEPPPLVASHPGHSVITEAFKTAWRNFVGVLAGAIASLGFITPILVLGWGAVVVAKRYRRKTA